MLKIASIFMGFAALSAHASSESVNYSAIVNLSFDGGEGVKSVTAHVGLHEKAPAGLGGQESWAGTQDLQMTANGKGQWTATTILNSGAGTGSGGSTKVFGPKVSYLVTYASGKTEWAKSDVAVPFETLCSYASYPSAPSDNATLVKLNAFLQKPVKASAALLISSAEQGSGAACVANFIGN